MAQTIKLKRSGTQNAVPSTSQLALGEVALNTYDGKMYIKKSVGGTESIVEIGGDATSSSGLDFTGNLNLADNVRIVIGDGNDLQIYHDGSDSYILENGTGDLFLGATNLRLTNGNASSTYLQGIDGGAVDIRHNNSVKLATTSSGISVTGDITLTGNVFTDEGFYGNRVWNEDNSALRFATNNTERMRIDANGRLLVNTTSSIDNFAKIQVVGDSSSLARITLKDVDGTNQYTYFEQSGGGTRINTQNGTANGFFTIGAWNGTASSDFLRVTAEGRVGIGTTSPAGNLHIKSLNNVGDATLIIEADADNNFENDNPRIELRQDNNLVGGYIYLEGNAATTAVNTIANSLILDAKASSTAGSHSIQFATGGLAPNQSGGPTNSSVRMTITDDGKVGIGTTSPGRKLTIQGGSGDNLPVRIIGGANTTHGSIEFQDPTTTADYKVTLGSKGDDLYFQAGGGEKARIDSSGNLLVGTTTADAEGITLRGDSHYLKVVRNGAITAYFDRKTSDGDIVQFRKGGSSVGSIGSNLGRFYIHNNYGSGSGFRFDNAAIRPSDSSGASEDATTDLGASAARFKDLYLSGQVSTSKLAVEDGTVGAPSITFQNDTNTGIYRSSSDQLRIATGGAWSAYFEQSGIHSSLNVYTAAGGDFRNYGGEWHATTGTSGNGFKFTNTADSVDALAITSAGNATFAGTISSGAITSTGSTTDNTADALNVRDSSNTQLFRVRNDGVVLIGDNYLYVTSTQGAYFDGAVRFRNGITDDTGQLSLNSSTGDITFNSCDLESVGTISSGNITTTGYLRGPSTFTIDPAAHGDDTGTVVIAGNLQVDGTTTTINSTTLTVDDKNITLASGSTNAAAANGAGITVDCGSNEDATWTYSYGDDAWKSNKHILAYTGDGTGVFAVGRDANQAIKIDVSDTYNKITAHQDSDENQDHFFDLIRDFAGTGKADFRILNDSDVHMLVDKTGNVGIGTDSPSNLLTVNKDTGSTPTVYINNSGAQATEGLALKVQASGRGTGIADVSIFSVHNNTTELFTVRNDGNVGIGTASPSRKLEVDFTGSTVGARFTRSDTAGSSTIEFANSAGVKSTIGFNAGTNEFDIQHNAAVRFSVNNSGAATFNNAFTLPTSDGSANQVLKTDGSGNVTWATEAAVSANTSISDADGDTKIQVEEGTDDDTIRFDTAGSQRMMITSSGRVRINNDNSAWDGLGTLLVKQASNNVGIGIIDQNSNNTLQLRNNGTYSEFYYNVNNPIAFSQQGGERMRIDSSGRVGIGTTTPTDVLEISKQLSAAQTVDFPLVVSSRDDSNSINQLGGEGVGLKFKLANNSSANPGGSFVGAGIAAIRESSEDSNSSTSLAFYASQNDETLDRYMTIRSSGNVGIGTDSPAQKLHVQGTTSIIRVQSTSANANASIWFNSNVGGTQANRWEIGTNISAGGDLEVYDRLNGASRMVIEPSGNVGIGTTSPNAKLHSIGHSRLDGAILQKSNLSIGSGNISTGNEYISHNGPILTNGSTGNINQYGYFRGYQAVYGTDGTNGYNPYAQGAYSNPIFEFVSNNRGSIDRPTDSAIRGGYLYQFVLGNSGSSGSNGGVELTNSNTTLLWGITSSNHAYFANRVGINNNSPNYPLDVTATGSGINIGGSGAYLRWNSGDIQIKNEGSYKMGFYTYNSSDAALNRHMVIDTSGNVGIGVDSPGTTLHLQNSSTNSEVMRLTTTGDNPDRNMYFQSDHIYSDGSFHLGSGSHRSLYRASYHTFHYGSGSTEAMRIHTNGNVGIGTTTPLDLLHLNSSSGDVRQLLNAPTGSDAEIKFSENGTVKYTIGHDAATSKFVIGTTNVDTEQRFVIDSSGKVGIGTTSPVEKLSIGGGRDINFHIGGHKLITFCWAPGNSNLATVAGKPAEIRHEPSSGKLRFAVDGTSRSVGDTVSIETVLTLQNGRAGIGNDNPVAKLQVEELGIDTTTTTTAATTQVAIDTMAAATFRSAEFTIQVTNSTDSTYHLTKVLLIHDGTTPGITEYGTVFTGSAAEATFDADISSGNVRLLATPASTDSMTFKVVRHCITV